MSCAGGASLSQISKAALPVLDTKQAGRFKKGHGEPRTSIDLLIAATKGKKSKEKEMYICHLFVCAHGHSNNFTQNENYIVDI